MASDGFVKWLDGPTYAAQDERRLAAVQQMPDGINAFGARSGRRLGPGLQVSTGGSPEGWTVTAGAGRIFDPNHSAEGAYDFEIPASVTGQLPARPSAGSSRLDLIVARVYPTGDNMGVKVEHLPGTPGTSPFAPDVPEYSTTLATLTVPATGAISAVRSGQVAVAAGGIMPIATTSARDSLSPYAGLTVFNEQTDRLEFHDGTAWRTVGPSSGPTLAAVNGGHEKMSFGNNWVDVTHGLGVMPKSVVVTPSVTWPTPGAWMANISSWTETNFRVYARYYNNTTVTATVDFNWIALA